MKILLITEWFPPVKGAAAKRTRMMAESLQKQGHKVTVLTSFPSYPSGVLPKKYHWKLWDQEKSKGLDILRVWEFPTPNTGTFKRILRELSFFLTSAGAALILMPYDAVIVSSPSFLSGLSGLAATREKQIKFYFDIRDPWPDALIDLNILKEDGLATNLLKKLERYYYKRATKIMVAAPYYQKHLMMEGISEDKILLLMNAADTKKFSPRKIDRSQTEFKNDDFVCLYLGNHAPLYGLGNVLKAAKILEKQTKIKFLLVGEGEEKESLMAQAKNATNVIFWDEVAYDQVPKVVNLADLALMPINQIHISQNTVPSKTSEYLASGKPIITSIGGATKKIILEAKAGLFYPSNEPEMLANNILKIYRNKNLRQKMAQNARRLALKMFSEKTFSEKLKKIF